ncbi:hypothetical protein [Halorussus sp. AFM4]
MSQDGSSSQSNVTSVIAAATSLAAIVAGMVAVAGITALGAQAEVLTD